MDQVRKYLPLYKSHMDALGSQTFPLVLLHRICTQVYLRMLQSVIIVHSTISRDSYWKQLICMETIISLYNINKLQSYRQKLQELYVSHWVLGLAFLPTFCTFYAQCRFASKLLGIINFGNSLTL